VEFLKTVGSRRSIRWFKTWQTVSDEQIQRILEAARMCTSPGNLQPWRAIVVKRDDLSDADRDALLGADNWQGGHVQAPVWIYWFADPAALTLESFVARTSELLRAEASPLEFGWDIKRIEAAIDHGEEMPEGTAPIHEWSGLPIEIATAAAAQETNGAAVVAVLAATDMGLSTCLHMASKPSAGPKVKQILGVPDHWHPVWVQLLGYAAEDPNGGGQRPRLPFDQLFFKNKYGSPFPRSDEVVEQMKDAGLIQPEAPAPNPTRREEHRNLARMYGYPEA
jgi:nitroreductase